MWKWLIVLCMGFTMSLSANTKVLAFAGSSRKDSVNKKLVQEAVEFARQAGADVILIDLKDYPMPFYDADFEAKEKMPEKAKQFRSMMIQSDVIMIASPEYNSSLPGQLKNALDWASRSEEGSSSRDAFKDKKFIIMSASPGSLGGARGLIHLRSIIQNIGGVVVSGQIVVPGAYDAFDEQGHLKDKALREQLKELVQKSLMK